jgi:CRP-like cAMP-binding protein
MNWSPENDKAPADSEFSQNLQLLRELPFFAGMPLQALKIIVYLCSREIFEPKDVLFQQGDDDGLAILVVSGTANLTHKHEDRTYLLRQIVPGEFVGGLSLMCTEPRLYTAQASTPMTCLVLERGKFSHVMEEYPEIRFKAIKAITNSIFHWEQRLLRQAAELTDPLNQIVGVSLL